MLLAQSQSLRNGKLTIDTIIAKPAQDVNKVEWFVYIVPRDINKLVDLIIITIIALNIEYMLIKMSAAGKSLSIPLS